MQVTQCAVPVQGEELLYSLSHIRRLLAPGNQNECGVRRLGPRRGVMRDVKEGKGTSSANGINHMQEEEAKRRRKG